MIYLGRENSTLDELTGIVVVLPVVHMAGAAWGYIDICSYKYALCVK